MPENGCSHCVGSHLGRRPCLASATTKTRAWLLIEHPGPWAENVADTPMAAPLARAVDRARRHGVRPQLVRRPGRRRATPPVRVFAGFSGDEPWLEECELTDPAGLDDLDLAAVAAGRAPRFGTVVAAPVFLVCTHGRHNACCARAGAPLARALRGRFDVWETTHVGGDRFAANLVCLPHGLCYGALDEARATAAAGAYLDGRVVLDRYRGRVGQPEPAQAAEHFVRAHTGALGVGDVRVETMTGDTAVVHADQARYRVRVERVTPPVCAPGCADNDRTYVNKGLALLNGAPLM